MAINSRNRRAASTQFMLPFVVAPPKPDGSLGNVYDRMHMAHMYPVGIPPVSSGRAVPHRVRPGRSWYENAQALRELNAILKENDNWRQQVLDLLNDALGD